MQIWTLVGSVVLALASSQGPAGTSMNVSIQSPSETQGPVSPGTSAPPPAATAAPAPKGPICECGYTYCASVLMAMKVPWTTKDLTDAYCSTENANCPNGKPASDVKDAVYICLCNELNQKVGNNLDLLCGCDKCLNIGPDFRGRCASPCVSAGKKH